MIQIGAVDLSRLCDGEYQTLYSLASPERQRWADRYLRPSDAQRCIVADGLLRWVLKQALGTEQLSISKTAEGKPFLTDYPAFHFNLSHSGHWVVIAWGDRPMGVDVQMMDRNKGTEQLAQRFYHPDEQSYVFAVDSQERSARFFEIWTKKESYLKFQGTGINRDLRSFSVLAPEDAAFYTQPLPDAMLSLCAQDPTCRVISMTPSMLLSE